MYRNLLLLFLLAGCNGEKSAVDQVFKQLLKLNKVLSEVCALDHYDAREEYGLNSYKLVVSNLGDQEAVDVKLKGLLVSLSSTAGLNVVRLLPSAANLAAASYARNLKENKLEVVVPYDRDGVVELTCREELFRSSEEVDVPELRNLDEDVVTLRPEGKKKDNRPRPEHYENYGSE